MEIWKEIPDFDGWYDVSSFGKIRSWRNGKYGKRSTPRIMKTPPDVDGYERVNLKKDEKPHTFLVHALVLTAFISHRPKGMESCHNNGDRRNNHPYNLRWDTHKNNLLDTLKHGNTTKGERSGNAKLKSKDVLKIRSLSEKGFSRAELGRSFNVPASHISNIVHRKRWTHI